MPSSKYRILDCNLWQLMNLCMCNKSVCSPLEKMWFLIKLSKINQRICLVVIQVRYHHTRWWCKRVDFYFQAIFPYSWMRDQGCISSYILRQCHRWTECHYKMFKLFISKPHVMGAVASQMNPRAKGGHHQRYTLQLKVKGHQAMRYSA